jgi:hypothetical protein
MYSSLDAKLHEDWHWACLFYRCMPSTSQRAGTQQQLNKWLSPWHMLSFSSSSLPLSKQSSHQMPRYGDGCPHSQRERVCFPRTRSQWKGKSQPSFLPEIHLADPLGALLDAAGKTDSRFFERWNKESKVITWIPRSASPEATLCPWTSWIMAQQTHVLRKLLCRICVIMLVSRRPGFQWHLSQPSMCPSPVRWGNWTKIS